MLLSIGYTTFGIDLNGLLVITDADVSAQEDPSLLSHLLEALDSGAPPHGGIALGKLVQHNIKAVLFYIFAIFKTSHAEMKTSNVNLLLCKNY